MVRAVRYLKQYYRPAPGVVEVESTHYLRDGARLPAIVYRPVAHTKQGSAWVVLHGLTYHGARHRGLARFAAALAAAGHLVIIPEIEEWSRLQIAPQLTGATIHGSIDALLLRDDVDPERIGIFGFSFGATQALIAASSDTLATRIRVLLSWGGYADIARLVHFGLTGEHDVDGVRERIEPDPYGRWIVGANYLTSIPEYGDMTRVADALLQLAREAGRTGTYAGDAAHDPLKRQLAGTLDTRARAVFELFAPVNTHDLAGARLLAAELAQTIVTITPLMDPGPHLAHVRVPVMIAHGRDDRLIPYSESLLLQRRLPDQYLLDCTITALFAHSGGTGMGQGPIRLARETGRFLGMLDRILSAL